MVSLRQMMFFLFQAEDGIRDLVRSRGLGDVYKRQGGGSSVVVPVMSVEPAGADRDKQDDQQEYDRDTSGDHESHGCPP